MTSKDTAKTLEEKVEALRGGMWEHYDIEQERTVWTPYDEPTINAIIRLIKADSADRAKREKEAADKRMEEAVKKIEAEAERCRKNTKNYGLDRKVRLRQEIGAEVLGWVAKCLKGEALFVEDSPVWSALSHLTTTTPIAAASDSQTAKEGKAR